MERKTSSLLFGTFTFDRTVKLFLCLLVGVVLLVLVRRLSGVLMPFAIAWLLAYLMYPLMKFYQQRCRMRHRPIAIACTLLSVVLAFLLVLLIVIPPIVREIGSASSLIGNYIAEIENSTLLPEKGREAIASYLLSMDLTAFIGAQDETVTEIVRVILERLWQFVGRSVDFIVSLFVVFIVFLYTVFILLDYEAIGKGFRSLLPSRYERLTMMVFHDLEENMNRYFRGQFKIASLVGILLSIGFYIIGLPLGILLGLLMGMLNIVPYLKLVMLPVLGFFAFVGAQQNGTPFWLAEVLVFGVVVIVQVLEDMFIVPRIMGKNMSMNPAVMLLSLSIWGSLLGVVGMIVALPVTSVLLSLYRRYVLSRMDGHGEIEKTGSNEAGA